MATVRHLGLFPFCVSEQPVKNTAGDVIEVGAGTFYPLSVSTEDALAIWWRVKKWRVSFLYEEYEDLTYSGEYNGSYREIQSSAVSVLTSTGSPQIIAASERDLVCLQSEEQAAAAFQWQATFQVDGMIFYEPPPPPDPTPPPTVISFERTDPIVLSFGLYGEVFSPLFVRQDSSNLFVQMRLAIGQTQTTYPFNQTTGIFEINGREYSFLIGTQFEDDGIARTITNLRVAPEEYFAYDPNDGMGPIYDTTTGEQLRPFPA